MASLGGARGKGAPVDSAVDAAAVTPGAGALAGGPTRGLWIGTGGSVTVTMLAGSSVTFAGIADGTLLPIQVTHVTAVVGAGSIIALY
jgi:hypothetical protein